MVCREDPSGSDAIATYVLISLAAANFYNGSGSGFFFILVFFHERPVTKRFLLVVDDVDQLDFRVETRTAQPPAARHTSSPFFQNSTLPFTA